MARHRYKKSRQPPPKSEAAAAGGYQINKGRYDDFGNVLHKNDPTESVRANVGNPRVLFEHKIGGKGRIDPSAYRNRKKKLVI